MKNAKFEFMVMQYINIEIPIIIVNIDRNINLIIGNVQFKSLEINVIKIILAKSNPIST